MKSAFWRSIAVVALVAVPMMANANDATIGSEVATDAMYGATLMNTTAVFNAFPHMVTENGTGVELNTMGNGMGSAWWEAYDNWWLTMDVGRMDYGLRGTSFMWSGSTSGIIFPGSSIFEDYSIVNMGIARATSGGGAWALGVDLAPFGGSESTGGAVETEDNLTAYGVNGSWGNGDGLDLSAEFAMSKYEDINNTADTQDDYKDMGFGVSARYAADLYIYQGNFFYTSGTTEGDSFAETIDSTGLGIYGSAGRYLKNEVDGQATAEFGVGYVNFKDEAGDASQKFNTLLLPAVRFAAWEMIGDHFGIMGGVGFSYAFDTFTDDDGTNEVEDKDSGSVYDWRAGLFFQPTDNVRIDARFQEGNLDQILSLGNQQPLVFYLGATVGLN